MTCTTTSPPWTEFVRLIMKKNEEESNKKGRKEKINKREESALEIQEMNTGLLLNGNEAIACLP